MWSRWGIACTGVATTAFLFYGQSYFIHSLKRRMRPESAKSEVAPGDRYDIAVIGGGIVGIATARELQRRHRSARIVVLEKEHDIAQHQTSHNSGVIHAGIYYAPGTHRARLCVRGAQMMYDYCAERNIPTRKCGKLVVATREDEVERLQQLFKRALANGVPEVKYLASRTEIQALEPKITGVAAIHSPFTGIVDYAEVTRKLAEEFRALGGEIRTNCKVENIKTVIPQSEGDGEKGEETATSGNGECLVLVAREPTADGKYERNIIASEFVVGCAGLHADLVAQMGDGAPSPAVVPIRGSFYRLRKEYCSAVSMLVYPVPDPAFPWLGVHFTPRMDGELWVGPSAVLAFAREGYRFRNFDYWELFHILHESSILRFVRKHPRDVFEQLYRDLFPSRGLYLLSRFMPEIERCWLEKERASGVRAVAMDEHGDLVKDFVFEVASPRQLHVRNAPSPAATASLAIAEEIADMADQTFFSGESPS